jgi:exodeoxyribonuclease V beta subunit
LLYVALTRARHMLWLGVAALPARAPGETMLADSALGYLLGGGAAISAAELPARWAAVGKGSDAIAVCTLDEPDHITMLTRADEQAPLADARAFDASFERDWSVGSFTSLTRQTNTPPARAQEETLLEEDARPDPARTEDAPWHRFPRGSMPGNFLHEQLEWIACEGFGSVDEPHFETRLGLRCDRSGWGNRKEDAANWLRAAVHTVLPPAGVALVQLQQVLPEMEFWFPSERLQARALDQLCRQHSLDGCARPAVPDRQLHGMLKGFADLVFEHDGRFWVLDYKSNALGAGDAAYHAGALTAAMAAHRYDIQGALYMLALHRLLRSRLGPSYDPQRQLGGAVFLFLRGIANPATRGCAWLAPVPEMIDALDRMMGQTNGEAR